MLTLCRFKAGSASRWLREGLSFWCIDTVTLSDVIYGFYSGLLIKVSFRIRRCCDVDSTSHQRRINAVCPVAAFFVTFNSNYINYCFLSHTFHARIHVFLCIISNETSDKTHAHYTDLRAWRNKSRISGALMSGLVKKPASWNVLLPRDVGRPRWTWSWRSVCWLG